MYNIKHIPHSINIKPKLIIGFEYLSIIEILTQTVDIEYMTLMTVKRNGYDFIVDNICLPEQLCDSAHTELTSMGEGHVMMELSKNFTVWQHSHINLPINPSSQDYETLDDFAYRYGKEGYMIMMITNRRGEMILVYKDNLIECTMNIEIVYDPSKLNIVEDFITNYKSRILPKPKIKPIVNSIIKPNVNFKKNKKYFLDEEIDEIFDILNSDLDDEYFNAKFNEDFDKNFENNFNKF